MKERPILYAGPMVRAILDGRKTQTRRVVKPQPEWRDVQGLFSSWVFKGGLLYPNAKQDVLALCPYGQPGDQLWVRETWAYEPDDERWAKDPTFVIHRAGYLHDSSVLNDDEQPWWRPSIHMPRWASRITLEITGVSVERLQDISEADAIAEGLIRDGDGWRGAADLPWFASPVAAFRSLWESINGASSWDANPWVWVVEFRRIEQEAKAA